MHPGARPLYLDTSPPLLEQWPGRLAGTREDREAGKWNLELGGCKATVLHSVLRDEHRVRVNAEEPQHRWLCRVDVYVTRIGV